MEVELLENLLLAMPWQL